MPLAQSEITIVGGGVVGLSVAMGLLLAGKRVRVLDGSDGDARASQGNFGLVWGQGKGWNFAPYSSWTSDGLAAWPEFASKLRDLSGIDVSLDQSGGFEFFTDQAEMDEFAGMLAKQQTHAGNQFSHDILSGDDLRKDMPGIGPDVIGATFSPHDGHVNPLRFLRALRLSVLALGGEISTNCHVNAIKPTQAGAFDVNLTNGTRIGTEKVLLCAGLGAQHLTADLGFKTNIRPQRGELLITEKLGVRLPFLSSTIRQVDEGGVQIGGTKADAGMDASETLDVMADLAAHAVAVYPALRDVRVVRAWGALRVMSPDGYPVYSHSRRYPGAYLITCHSGVTLASVHASSLIEWIENSAEAPNLEAFDENRFALSNAA